MKRCRQVTIASIVFLLFSSICAGGSFITIKSISGDVKVRRSMDEHWNRAGKNMRLKKVDTILTSEASSVTLELADGRLFKLGGNAILDISDLRKISERELFLHIMSKKIGGIKAPSSPSPPIRLKNVSAVRAENRDKDTALRPKDPKQKWTRESNGARALYEQEYYPNTILKLHRVLIQFPRARKCSEIYYLLGRSFEKLGQPGRAKEAYRTVLQNESTDSCAQAQAVRVYDLAATAIERISKHMANQ